MPHDRPPRVLPDLDKLTVGQIFTILRQEQFWALLLAFGSVIGAAFGLGYKFASNVQQVAQPTVQAQLATATTEKHALDVQQEYRTHN